MNLEGCLRMAKNANYHSGGDSATMSLTSTSQGSSATWRDFVALAKPGILRSNGIAVFAGFWLASHWSINYISLLWTLLGSLLVMASSCVFNNYLDREMDTKMERTKKRALPTGKISPTTVLAYATILGIVGLTTLFLFSGWLAGVCGMVGMVVYVLVYTMWLKRTSTWSTSVGAISGAMPPVIGYVAVSGKIDLGAILLFAMLFLWQPPHFWALGIRRVEEYRAAGFPLLPVVKGIPRTKIQMLPYIALLIPIPILMYVYNYTGIWFLIIGEILSVLWLVMAVKGFNSQDNDTWAKKVFLFSINYLTIMLLVIVLDTTWL